MKKLLLYIVILLNISIYAQDKEKYIKPYFGVWEFNEDNIITRWDKDMATGGRLYFESSIHHIEEGTVYIGKDSLITYVDNLLTKKSHYASYKLIGRKKLEKTTYSTLYKKEILDVVVYKLIKKLN